MPITTARSKLANGFALLGLVPLLALVRALVRQFRYVKRGIGLAPVELADPRSQAVSRLKELEGWGRLLDQGVQ